MIAPSPWLPAFPAHRDRHDDRRSRPVPFLRPPGRADAAARSVVAPGHLRRGRPRRTSLAGGRDQSLSLFLPHPGQDAPVVPVEAGDGWWQRWRGLPDDVRAVMRSYTRRAQRRRPRTTTRSTSTSCSTHDGPGGAARPRRWAERAAAGDRVMLLGPAVADNTAVRFRPPAGHRLRPDLGRRDRLPAAPAILESLPAGTRRPGLAGGPARRGHPGPGDRGRRRDHLARAGRASAGPHGPRRHPRRRTAGRRAAVRLDRGRVRDV